MGREYLLDLPTFPLLHVAIFQLFMDLFQFFNHPITKGAVFRVNGQAIVWDRSLGLSTAKFFKATAIPPGQRIFPEPRHVFGAILAIPQLSNNELRILDLGSYFTAVVKNRILNMEYDDLY